ncbi:MAG: ABC transporter substrate-binding protein [Alphaproteobacteria bacterium]|nr:ABC transporter substrate-binding protein [Alphaproteobacteria bacterium]
MRARTGKAGSALFRRLRAALLALGLLAPALPIPALPAGAGDVRVGFVNPGMDGELFWLLVSATMQAAAGQLNIDVDIRYTKRNYERAIQITKDFLAETPPPDYLVATNDIGVGGDVIKLADAAGVPLILLSNDLDPKDWKTYGEPRTKYRRWLGSIVPDHEGGGYEIAEAVLGEAQRIKSTRPLNLIALAGDAETPASNDRVHGLQRAFGVFQQLLGKDAVKMVAFANGDWTEAGAYAWMKQVLPTVPRADAVWAANDPMAFGLLRALEEAGYNPGKDVVVGGLNWSQGGIDRVLNGEMLLTHGGHFLGGAWVMVLIRDNRDGRDFAEEDVRLQFPMGAFYKPIAQRFPDIGKIDWRRVDFRSFSKSRNPNVQRYAFTPDAVLNQLPAAR